MATLTGNEILYVQGVQANGKPSGQTLQTTTEEIAALAALSSDTMVVTALNTVGAGTITAAGIVGQYVQRGGEQLSAAFTDTSATANAITAALPSGVNVGTAFTFNYANLTNAPATLAGGSGVTISNITIVPPNAYAKYLFTYTAVSTYTMVGIEQGYYPHGGTYTSIGTAAVTVADTSVTTYSQISFTLRSVVGTIVGAPVVKTKTVGVGFTASAGTTDLSVYMYNILG